MLYKKRCKKIKIYAREFCDILRNEMKEPLLARGIHLTDEYPLVRTYKQFGLVTDSTYIGYDIGEKTKDGSLIIGGLYEDGVIEVYGITKRSFTTLKEVTRHECIHFMLHKSNLPSKDDDDFFNMIAMIYNAMPTKLIASLTRILETEGDE